MEKWLYFIILIFLVVFVRFMDIELILMEDFIDFVLRRFLCFSDDLIKFYYFIFYIISVVKINIWL